jgi:N-acetylglutamate synthase-like GNAT family acetyltransferase
MESVQAYSVNWLPDVGIPLANKFYREHRFRGKARRHESCAVVRDEHGVIIGCGYIRDHSAFKLLTGVAVAPAYRGRGVARLLLQLLAGRLDHDTYTFPYEHLLSFYASFGFKQFDAERQPLSVKNCYQRYRNQGREIEMMVYQTD